MSKRRVEMYEEKLPSGRCKYRMPYIDPLTEKHKTISIIMESQSASNYKLALRTLQEKLDNILLDAPQEDMTLKQFAVLYLSEKKNEVKASTIQRDSTIINQIVEWLGPDIRYSRLTVPYVKKIFRSNCPKAVTYNETIKRFKIMINWLYNNDYIDSRKIADKLQALPDQKKTRIKDKYLEQSELQLLLDSANNDYWKLVIKFLAFSGLRIGELIALKDSDIDDKYIHVTKTYEVTVGIVDTPKTEESYRDVYLRPELNKCIKEIRSYIRVYKFERGIQSDLFICWSDGNYLHYDAFRKYLGKLSSEVLNHRITPHALRHTATSLLVAEGVPLETVSRQLGHSDSKITKEIYLHITQQLKERDNEILQNVSML